MIIHVNGQPREVAPPVRLRDVLDLPDGATVPRGIAVAVDGQVIPRPARRHGAEGRRKGGDRDSGAGWLRRSSMLIPWS